MSQSTQEQIKCACVAWSTRRGCVSARNGNRAHPDDECSCRCHDIDEEAERAADDEADFADDDESNCFHCAGTGYTDCDDPLECTASHLGGRYGMDGDEVCPCSSCGGSGLAKDMTIW